MSPHFPPRLPALRQLTLDECRALGRKGPLWRLEEDYVRFVSVLGCDVRIRAGLITDGASRPVWAKWLIARWGRHTAAVILHDGINAGQAVHDQTGRPIACEFEEWNGVFFEIARQDGTPRWKAEVMYRAISSRGGRQAWRNGREARAAQGTAWMERG